MPVNPVDNSSPEKTTSCKIACIGECMVELRASGENQYESAFAGDTLNTAIYLSRSNLHQVQFVSVVGNDDISAHMIDAWQSEGIDTSLVGRHESRLPGLYMIENDSTGERTFRYWRSMSAARTLFLPESQLNPQMLSQADAIYTSGITLAIMDPQAREALITFLAEFRDNGGEVAFDSNYRPALWENVETARDTVSRMWSVATLGFPSVDDEQALYGDADEAAVIDRLTAFGMREVLLKRGHLGPRLITTEGEIEAGLLGTAEQVIDTTGAGDSFNAGYLANRLAGMAIPQAACLAHELAMKVIAHPGAILPR